MQKSVIFFNSSDNQEVNPRKQNVSPPPSPLWPFGLEGCLHLHQQQKFHTDDIKSVRNLVRSSNWSYVHAVVKLYYTYFFYEKQTNAKGKWSQRSHVNMINLLQNGQYSRRSFTEKHKINFTIINQGKHKIKQIYIWNPKTT